MRVELQLENDSTQGRVVVFGFDYAILLSDSDLASIQSNEE